MAVTLSEASKYTQNMVRRGVLETIIKDSAVLTKLPFIDVVGNAYKYLREATLPTASYFDPNEVWTEDTGTVTEHTAVLRILGGDADVDNFLKESRSNLNDLEGETIESKSKAVKHTFLNSFWYGDNDVNTKEFDGMHEILSGIAAQNIHVGSGTTGAALDIKNLDTLTDLILDGPPDCIISPKAIRRRVAQFIRKQTNVNTTRDQYGVRFMEWDGAPWYIDDFLTMTEALASGAFSAKTGGATGSIFALRFGTKDVLGFQLGGMRIIKIGQLESKDAKRTRIRWYVSIGLLRDFSAAIIDGVTDAVVTDA